MGGNNLYSSILSDRNKSIFEDTLIPKVPNQAESVPELQPVHNRKENLQKQKQKQVTEKQEGDRFEEMVTAAISSQATEVQLLGSPSHQSYEWGDRPVNLDDYNSELSSRILHYYHPQHQNIINRNKRQTQIHAEFLKGQQESMQQITEIVDMQIDISRQWIERREVDREDKSTNLLSS